MEKYIEPKVTEIKVDDIIQTSLTYSSILDGGENTEIIVFD